MFSYERAIVNRFDSKKYDKFTNRKNPTWVQLFATFGARALSMSVKTFSSGQSLEVDRWTKDVASPAPKLYLSPSSLHLNILSRSVVQRTLSSQSSPEAELITDAFLHLIRIHGLRLYRVEHIKADFDEVGQNRRNIAIRVEKGEELMTLGTLEYSFKPWLNESPPV